MKKFGLDLSKFKKTGSDEKTTTLRSDDGHEIRVAHGALDERTRKALSKLPMAEKKSDAKAEKKEPAGKDLNPKPKRESAPAPQVQHFAEGGQVEEDPNIQEIDLAQTPAPQASVEQPMPPAPAPVAPQQAPVVVNVQAAPAPQPAPAPAAPAMPEPTGAYKAGEALRRQAMASPMGLGYQAAQKLLPMVGSAAQDVVAGAFGNPAGASNAPEPALSGQPTPTAGGPAPTPGEPSKPGDPYGTEEYYKHLTKGIADQKSGLMAEASALEAQGKQEKSLLESHVEAQKQAQASYQQSFQQLEAERQAFLKDINENRIDPQRYLNSMGTGKKITTAIGLILGGMGGGSGDNPVLKMLNERISQDIEAQKAEIGKKENLLNANLRQFGNLRDAMDMTRVMSADIIANQLKQAAATAQGPVAKARALQAIGKLEHDNAQVLSQIAMRRTLLSGVSSGKVAPEQVIRFVVPQGEQQHAFKELKEAQGMVAARDNIIAAFDKLSKLNTIANGALSPIQTKRAVAAIKEPLTAALSKETAGRFTEQDAKMLDSLWPEKMDTPETEKHKRQAIVKLITEKFHFPMLKAYGIDVGGTGRYTNQGQSRIRESAPVLK